MDPLSGRGSPGDLFAKCDSPRVQEYRMAEALGLLPYFREMDSESGPVVDHDGRQVIMLGSNNYLGLTGDARVKRAALDAVERYGSGCTGSRLMNGSLPLHRELETELADWTGTEACLVFTTGYTANLGLISTLVSSRDAVFVDSSGHASLIDGGRLASGTLKSFRHNSVTSLNRRLKEWMATAEGGALVAVDGVYSMEGDLAPLGPVADVCAATGARLLVDEAHALGVLGPEGAGAAADAGVQPDLVMGTFSKSLGSCGGFVGGPTDVIDYLRVSCRPFLFTASGVPAAMAAALAATRIARDEDWRRDAVRDRADQLRQGLCHLGYQAGPEHSAAIVAVQIGDDWHAARLWRCLLDLGVYTNCAVSPAVAPGSALLRTSVIATHTEAQIDRALDAFEVARSTLA
ncbi:MAG: aminotransferase class I/II-fold pyridoxal phosphate-dependent enzyme [Acidimicrobiales bacterium]